MSFFSLQSLKTLVSCLLCLSAALSNALKFSAAAAATGGRAKRSWNQAAIGSWRSESRLAGRALGIDEMYVPSVFGSLAWP